MGKWLLGRDLSLPDPDTGQSCPIGESQTWWGRGHIDSGGE